MWCVYLLAVHVVVRLCCMYLHTLNRFQSASYPQMGDIALFLPFSEGSFSKLPVKSFTLRLQLPLSQHTSFQHDLWVAPKDTQMGLHQSFPPSFLVICTNGFMEWDEQDFYFRQPRTQASVKTDN